MKAQDIKELFVEAIQKNDLESLYEAIAYRYSTLIKNADKYMQIQDRATVPEGRNAVLFSREDMEKFAVAYAHQEFTVPVDYFFNKWVEGPAYKPTELDYFAGKPQEPANTMPAGLSIQESLDWLNKHHPGIPAAFSNEKLKMIASLAAKLASERVDHNNQLDEANRARIEAENKCVNLAAGKAQAEYLAESRREELDTVYKRVDKLKSELALAQQKIGTLAPVLESCDNPPPRTEGWHHTERCLLFYQEENGEKHYGIGYYHYDPPYRAAGWIDHHPPHAGKLMLYVPFSKLQFRVS